MSDMQSAISYNWVAQPFLEIPQKTGEAIVRLLEGADPSFAQFSDAIPDGSVIPYLLYDDRNREVGYATLSDNLLTDRVITARLEDGVYIDLYTPSSRRGEGGDDIYVPPAFFPNGGTAACTFNAAAFNEMWSHIWDDDRHGLPGTINGGEYS